MATPFRSDVAVANYIRTGHIPGDDSASTTSYTLATGTIQTTTWTTTPAKPALSLWNYHLTLRVDTDDDNHKWPNGSSLSAAQSSLRVACYIDQVATNDDTNQLVVKICVENFSGSNRTIYMKYKTYSYAYVTGAST